MQPTSEQITRFEQVGFVVIPGLFDGPFIDSLAGEARNILAWAAQGGAGPEQAAPRLHNILSARPDEVAPVDGRLSLHVEHVFRHSSLFHDLIHDARLVGPMRAFCSRDLRLLDDQLYWKPGAVGGATYVHRDSDFFGPLRMATVWLPLCDVDEDNGCLWAIAGSHQRDRSLPGLRQRTAPPPGLTSEHRPFNFFYEVDFAVAGFVPIPLRAGDALFLHRHLVHCSLEVCSSRERMSYLIEYFAAEDLERYRESCWGLFAYQDRWRYVEPVRSPAGETT